jgi:peptidoglycan/LPS O-acetylase OafA/YrhL
MFLVRAMFQFVGPPWANERESATRPSGDDIPRRVRKLTTTPPLAVPGTAAQAARPKIHALTSIRFFAALYVVFFHTQWGVPPGSRLEEYLSMGNASVCFFFLLSGYILALVYLREGKPVAVRKFYVARFARIYPLYFAGLLLDFPFAVAFRVAKYGLGHAIERILILFAGSLVMMQMWMQASAAINGPSWSLCVETIFYVSFPFCGPWLWKLGKRQVWIAASLLYVIEVAMSGAIYHRRPYHVPGLDIVSFIAIFGLGVLVARWQSLNTEETQNDSRLKRKAWFVFALASLCAVGVASSAYWLNRMNLQPAYILAPVFMAWIWSLSVTQILPAWLLSARWLVVLGEASFGLYLIHMPVRHAFEMLHWDGSARSYPLYLGICIGLSLLSLYYLETPARRMILNRFHSRTKETLEASSDAQ